MKLISVKDALEITLQQTEGFGTEEVGFMNTLGRVLKETILSISTCSGLRSILTLKRRKYCKGMTLVSYGLLFSSLAASKM